MFGNTAEQIFIFNSSSHIDVEISKTLHAVALKSLLINISIVLSKNIKNGKHISKHVLYIFISTMFDFRKKKERMKITFI